jgi:hypothetical protein
MKRNLMAKIVSSYVNDEAVQKLAQYCSSHQCTQSSALANLLHQNDEDTITIIEDPNPVRDMIDGLVERALLPLQIKVRP